MHELRKRKNKVKIEVICPVLEVPFSNNPQWRHEDPEYGKKTTTAGKFYSQTEEKWVIAMGDLMFTNYQEGSS